MGKILSVFIDEPVAVYPKEYILKLVEEIQVLKEDVKFEYNTFNNVDDLLNNLNHWQIKYFLIEYKCKKCIWYYCHMTWAGVCLGPTTAGNSPAIFYRKE